MFTSVAREKLLVVCCTGTDSVSLQAENSHVNMSKTLLIVGLVGSKHHQADVPAHGRGVGTR